MTFTNRDQGDRHNRVLAGDFRYVWGLYYTQFQYGASFTSDAAGQPHRADLAGGVRPDRTLVGLQLSAEGTGPRLRRPGGVREPAPERRGQRPRLQPAHASTARAGRAAREPHRLLRARAHLALRAVRLQPGARGRRAARRHLPAPRRLGAERPRRARLRELPGLDLRRLHRRERRRPGVPAGGRLLRLRVADAGDDADLAAAQARTCSTAGDGPRSSRRARPATGWLLDRRGGPAPGVDGAGGAHRDGVPARPARRQRVRPLDHSAAQGRVPAAAARSSSASIGEYRSERRAALVDPATGAPLFVAGAAQPPTEFNGLRVDLLASFEPTPGTVAFLGLRQLARDRRRVQLVAAAADGTTGSS